MIIYQHEHYEDSNAACMFLETVITQMVYVPHYASSSITIYLYYVLWIPQRLEEVLNLTHSCSMAVPQDWIDVEPGRLLSPAPGFWHPCNTIWYDGNHFCKVTHWISVCQSADPITYVFCRVLCPSYAEFISINISAFFFKERKKPHWHPGLESNLVNWLG